VFPEELPESFAALIKLHKQCISKKVTEEIADDVIVRHQRRILYLAFAKNRRETKAFPE
jgi:hypothetical protein